MEQIGNVSLPSILHNAEKGERLLIAVLYGGMGGITSAGMLHALAEIGISPREYPNISVVGVSVGAANMLGYCAGRTGETPEVYARVAQHLLKRSWFDRAQIFDVLGVEYLMEILTQELGTNFLDGCKGDAFAVVTRVRDASCHIHSLQEASCPFTLTQASMCMPVLLQGTVEVAGEQYIDGACSLSIAQMIRRTRARNILVLGSRPLDGVVTGEPQLPTFILRQIAAAYPREVRKKSVYTDTTLADGIERLKRVTSLRWCALFPKGGVPWNEASVDALHTAFAWHHNATRQLCS
ncbi:hypothetical protein JXR01_03215 [Candidatus Kaiserbacteria bacterium]|nr:MAG: hypothetical protein JXR01_03215 [Candidatus Kaiserbacteria bacterium]